VNEAPELAWVVFFPFLWIAGWITASIIYRRIHDKPIFPRTPESALFVERAASGVNDSHWLGRIGHANRCLIVAVTGHELVVTPFFPFNLMFLPEIYGLEIRIPVSRIRRVGEWSGILRDFIVVEFDDGRSFRLVLRNPRAFRKALGRP